MGIVNPVVLDMVQWALVHACVPRGRGQRLTGFDTLMVFDGQ